MNMCNFPCAWHDHRWPLILFFFVFSVFLGCPLDNYCSKGGGCFVVFSFLVCSFSFPLVLDANMGLLQIFLRIAFRQNVSMGM